MSEDARNESEQEREGEVRASVDAVIVSSAPAASGEEPAADAGSPQREAIPSEMRQWAMFCHLAGLASWLVPWVGGIVATLIFWQVRREESAFVDDQGREALNFNITVAIVEAACLPFVCIYVGVFLYVAVAIGGAVFAILAALQASEGRAYRYPINLRLVT